jgi:hypothetical protein
MAAEAAMPREKALVNAVVTQQMVGTNIAHAYERTRGTEGDGHEEASRPTASSSQTIAHRGILW